jgi:electron transport complex protein RnfD
MNNLYMAPSPHIHSGDSIGRNMYGVLLALVPAFFVSLYYFGLGALIVTAVSVASCVLFEYLIQKYLMKEESTVGDGSAILTGVLLAFNLPSNLPVWIVILGAFVAIGIGKMSFGGLGRNIFNPALVGRVFLLISFPAQMTTWPVPEVMSMNYTDVETGATILTLLKEGSGDLPSYAQMLLGNRGGSLGEVGAIALVLGLIFMLVRRIITWHIPVAVIGTVFLFTAILHAANPAFASPPVHLLSGGLLLGAGFMATDYVTSPMSRRGMLIYGVGIGLLTTVIRLFGSYPEGMSFAILIMNALTPLINTYVKPKRFGEK